MPSDRTIVIGAGVGGLVAALDLATAGVNVTVLEKAAAPGGKMRRVRLAGQSLDAGPTVFTMRWVFEEIFANAGTSFERELKLKPLEILARHAWGPDERLDLFADPARSEDAIGVFAGAGEARRFRDFRKRAHDVYQTLEAPFIRSSQPTPMSLALGSGLKGFTDLWRIAPFSTLWKSLGDHFQDPRLRQLFGRYATYCGSSPFLAPATLMLVADVEQQGVWTIDGGMHELALALERVAKARGVTFFYDSDVAEITTAAGRASGVRLTGGNVMPASHIVVNADAAAVARGLLGSAVTKAAAELHPSARSLSAITWSAVAETDGFPLEHHNVFFSNDYAAEFNDIFGRQQLPTNPTVYVCAEDRGGESFPGGPERLLILANAPAVGDSYPFSPMEIAQCQVRTFAQLARCGLTISLDPEALSIATPNTFETLFPGTCGALYGQASHGWTASFSRPTSRTKIPGLYLAGGSTHPGPGVPMAALSGRLAAASLLADLPSRVRSAGTAMPGGTSMA